MKPPPGYTAVWSAIGAGALAVVVYNGLHHRAPVIEARPRVTVTVTVAPSRDVRPGRAPQAVSGPRAGTSAGRVVPPSTGPSPLPSPSGPSPSAPPGPASAGVSAVVVPLRGATPIGVRAAVVAPSAPPFPRLIPALGLGLGLGLGVGLGAAGDVAITASH